ncbi:MAG: MBL fold metallo-hydrolase [Myxococcota bacterium]|nr:MBL fold metallo-hydrolase [Myxococcota bacterium]
MNQLTFIGTADAFNAAGRGNSCYWIDDRQGAFMVDFGPTALMQCRHQQKDLARLDGVFLTHLHGDHMGGLAMLLMHLNFVESRTRPFVIAGPPETAQRLALLRESAYPELLRRGLNYPIHIKTWTIPGEINVLGRTVRAIRARHDTVATATSFTVKTEDYTVAFSGDTGWQPALLELVDGADVFVCECSNVTPDYWGHLSLEEIRRYRDAIRVGQLALTHLSTASREEASRVAHQLDAIIADDGMRIALPGPA